MDSGKRLLVRAGFVLMLAAATANWAIDAGSVAAEPGGPEQHRSAPDTEPVVPDGVIGVSLQVGAEHVGDQALLLIAHVLPDGPAQQAGLKPGDEIVTVAGAAVMGKTYQQVALMVRGEPGSTVKIGIKQAGGLREVSVLRAAGQTLYKNQMGSHGGSSR